MITLLIRKQVLLVAGGMLLGIASVLGQQKAMTQTTLLHVFAYAPVEKATQQDLDTFTKATTDLVGKIPGLKRVWIGKLKTPIDAPDGKQVYGVGMEFDDAKSFEAYADHPAHKEWERVYRKVRIAGTTTVDIVGQ